MTDVQQMILDEIRGVRQDIKDISKRVQVLENFRAWLVGAASVSSLGCSIIGIWLSKKFNY